MNVSQLSGAAWFVYDKLRFAYGEAGVSYGCVFGLMSMIGMEDIFLRDYGIAGEWEDVEDGSPIMIDVGELVHWVHKHS